MIDKLDVVIEEKIKIRVGELKHDTKFLITHLNKLNEESRVEGLSGMEQDRQKENTLKRIALNKSVVNELEFIILNYKDDFQGQLNSIKKHHTRRLDLILYCIEESIVRIDEYTEYIVSKAVLKNIRAINVEVRRAMEGEE